MTKIKRSGGAKETEIRVGAGVMPQNFWSINIQCRFISAAFEEQTSKMSGMSEYSF